jgi:putative acyl-CoA dehydrogenase
MDNAQDPAEAALARIGTTVAKYWNTKRCPSLVLEALECHGGSGYVEESIMPRLYREAPLNSIWEGSGNVMGLDVLRAMSREPESLPAFMAEVEQARGLDHNLDRTIDDLKQELDDQNWMEGRMRMITELMALTLQGALLTQHGRPAVAEAFCASRLAPRYRGAFGTLPQGLDLDSILDRASSG